MNGKGFVCLLMSLLLWSCAPLGSNFRLEGDTLVADTPRLAIKFKKEVSKIEQSGLERKVYFKSSDLDPVHILVNQRAFTQNVDYYYSLSAIASNLNFYYMGPEHLDGQEWAKVAKVADNGLLLCGYFTRKDHDFIFVLNTKQLGPNDRKGFEKLKKYFTPSPDNLAVITKQFESLHQSMEILN
jgi:hypothetical protein